MILAALSLGFLGSLHCVGMCGPLVLAMPAGQGGAARRWTRRAVYHAGRSLTYGLLGAVMGGIGQAVNFAGWQSGLSILAGLVVLFFAWPRRPVSGDAAPGPWGRAVSRAKAAWGHLLSRPGWGALIGLGALNGLLPCGLTYAALAAAALTGTPASGFAFMLAFGLATMPALLAVSAVPALLRPSWRAPLRRLVPAASLAVAMLFVLRGLGLGIPYLSPDLSGGEGGCCCHAAENGETGP